MAELARGVLRQKRARLEKLLAYIEFLEAAIARFSARIVRALEPYAQHVEHVQGIPGGNRKAAAMFLAEIGVDMSQFSSAAHLAS